jgi:hypothetical protein
VLDEFASFGCIASLPPLVPVWWMCPTTVMVACPASARAQCEYLTGPGGAVAGSGPRRLLRKHAGWYVHTVEYRWSRDGGAPSFAAGRASRPAASTLVAVSERRGPVKRASRAS